MSATVVQIMVKGVAPPAVARVVIKAGTPLHSSVFVLLKRECAERRVVYAFRS